MNSHTTLKFNLFKGRIYNSAELRLVQIGFEHAFLEVVKHDVTAGVGEGDLVDQAQTDGRGAALEVPWRLNELELRCSTHADTVQNAGVCGRGGRDLGGRHESHARIAPKFNDWQSPKWVEIAFVERNFRPGSLSLAQIARA
ncbi:hypothetical protein [Thiomonas sp. X19]|uniref:hypothetical protein n=1 Tax=Thiomonas sp. X19 TaxID=1050370 RepID=UPI0011BEBB0B|nr:hypothetical protein [Thiomonas sp. X19]